MKTPENPIQEATATQQLLSQLIIVQTRNEDFLNHFANKLNSLKSREEVPVNPSSKEKAKEPSCIIEELNLVADQLYCQSERLEALLYWLREI